MNKYTATFYSHYDALTFYNSITKKGIKAKLTPVPRKVSASCGTSVQFHAPSITPPQTHEIEAIYTESNNKYSKIWPND